jgi:hypothetical protein
MVDAVIEIVESNATTTNLTYALSATVLFRIDILPPSLETKPFQGNVIAVFLSSRVFEIAIRLDWSST